MVIWLALNQDEDFHNALSPAKSSLTLPLCPLCSTSVDGAIPWIVTTSSWYSERPDHNVCKTMTILRCLRRWTALFCVAENQETAAICSSTPVRQLAMSALGFFQVECLRDLLFNLIFSRSFFPVASLLCSFQCGPVLNSWNPLLAIGSATYPLGKWRDAVLAGKPWNTTDDERTSTCRIHPSQPKCLWDLREPKRKEEAWTVEIVEIVETGYLWEGRIACLMRICRVCFIFFVGGRWDRSISLGKHLVLGKSLECGMFVREYFWPNPLCRNQSNTRLGLLPKGLVLLKALRKVLCGTLRAAYTLWFLRICAFGMF